MSKEWVQKGQTVVEIVSEDCLGTSTAVSRVNVGGERVIAMGAPTFNENAGRVRIRRDGMDDTHIYGKDINDAFGVSVSLSDDGLTLAVGAPGIGGVNGQYVKIFTFDGTNWNDVKTLEGGNDAVSFGKSIDLSDDGEYLVVGDDQFSINQIATPFGRIKIFKNNSGAWDLIQTIQGAVSDRLGRSVSITDDGEYIAASAPNFTNPGKVFIYRRGVTLYSLVHTVSDGVNEGFGNKEFGKAIALRRFGATPRVYLAVGAPGSVNFQPEGVVSLYRADTGVFLGSLTGEFAVDQFGASVDLELNESENLLVLVGAPGFSQTTSRAGKIYLYLFEGDTESSSTSEIFTDEGTQQDGVLGVSVAASFNPDITPSFFFVAGESGITVPPLNSKGGLVRIYSGDNNSVDQIGERVGFAQYSGFGRSSATTDDGKRVVVGIPDVGAEVGFPPSVGAARVYDFDEDSQQWAPPSNVSTLVGYGFDRFGQIVEISGDGKTVAVAQLNAINQIVVFKEDEPSGCWIRESITIGDSGNPFFGLVTALSLNSDGTRLIINTNVDAFFYQFNGTNWVLVTTSSPSMSGKIYGDGAISSDGFIFAYLNEYDVSCTEFAKELIIGGTTIDTITLENTDSFGSNVSLSADGSRAVVNIERENGDILVRIFESSDLENWSQLGSDIDVPSKLKGFAEVAISLDGNRIGVLDHGTGLGGCFIAYDYDEKSGEWVQVGSGVPTNTSLFRAIPITEYQMDLAGDGDSVVVSEPVLVTDSLETPGQFRVFELKVPDDVVRDYVRYWSGVLNGLCA